MIPQRSGLWPHGNGSGKDSRPARTHTESPATRQPPVEGASPALNLPSRYRLALLAGLRQVHNPHVSSIERPGTGMVLPTPHTPGAARASGQRPPAKRGGASILRRTVLWGLAALLAAALLAGLSAGGFWLTGLRQELRETRVALNGANARLAEVERQGQASGQQNLAVLRREWRDELDSEVERLEARDAALRNDLSARLGPRDTPRKNFPAAFARARNALLFIRTDYRIKLLLTEEERTLTAFGTGFFITPGGVALTAQHVLFPWRYDRTLQASIEAGVVERIEGSTRISVWPTGTRVTRGEGGSDSDEADFLFQHAYRSDHEASPQVEVLRRGEVTSSTEQINTPLGMVEVGLPELGRGDWVLFQVLHPGKRFEHLNLAGNAAGVATLDEVMVVGYPLSRLARGVAEPQPSRGNVRLAGEDLLELDSPLHPGNSGGPVLDGKGNVVGLASAVLDSPVYGIAVPARELRRAWNELRTEIRDEQARLRQLGCEPGPLDGIPGPATRAARRCAKAIGST